MYFLSFFRVFIFSNLKNFQKIILFWASIDIGKNASKLNMNIFGENLKNTIALFFLKKLFFIYL